MDSAKSIFDNVKGPETRCMEKNAHSVRWQIDWAIVFLFIGVWRKISEFDSFEYNIDKMSPRIANVVENQVLVCYNVEWLS